MRHPKLTGTPYGRSLVLARHAILSKLANIRLADIRTKSSAYLNLRKAFDRVELLQKYLCDGYTSGMDFNESSSPSCASGEKDILARDAEAKEQKSNFLKRQKHAIAYDVHTLSFKLHAFLEKNPKTIFLFRVGRNKIFMTRDGLRLQSPRKKIWSALSDEELLSWIGAYCPLKSIRSLRVVIRWWEGKFFRSKIDTLQILERIPDRATA